VGAPCHGVAVAAPLSVVAVGVAVAHNDPSLSLAVDTSFADPYGAFPGQEAVCEMNLLDDYHDLLISLHADRNEMAVEIVFDHILAPLVVLHHVSPVGHTAPVSDQLACGRTVPTCAADQHDALADHTADHPSAQPVSRKILLLAYQNVVDHIGSTFVVLRDVVCQSSQFCVCLTVSVDLLDFDYSLIPSVAASDTLH